MTERSYVTVDGNEAAAHVAYQTSEVIALYPITPVSPMGELVDAWSTAGQKNMLGTVPRVVSMQGEGGVAGAVHGALQAGALVTTFTASQGLLQMIPDMYRIAGGLMPAVFHVAARSLSIHASSMYGDHSDVMAVRHTGWAMLAAASVQEAQDFALIAQAAALRSRVPFVHFFDGFRTSHEISKIEPLSPETFAAMIDKDLVQAHRDRALDPDRPVLRGSSQDSDVYFQSREAVNPFYDATPHIVQEAMNRFAEQTGRCYRLFEYVGDPAAERVLVLMGSGVGAAEEAVEQLCRRGGKVGLIKVRLFRPFDAAALAAALPATMRRIAVLDRTKEAGAVGEPLYQDVLAAIVEGRLAAGNAHVPEIWGGRYGLSSKEFTPAMAAAVLAESAPENRRRHFTVGIRDDVSHLSLPWDEEFSTEPDDGVRAVFFGLGGDGSVAANKLSLEIIGQHTSLFAQGYFVYGSRRLDALTVSHLRFSPRPIRSTYLIGRAGFVACHHPALLERVDVLEVANPGATFLLNCPYAPGDAWMELRREVQRQIRDKKLRFYVVDANRVASQVGLGENIGSVMQACFFWLSNVLPHAQAVEQIKHSIQSTYAKRGRSMVERYVAALDSALDSFHPVPVPDDALSSKTRSPLVPDAAPEFVQRVAAKILAGQGDRLPVSVLPADGTYPTATTRYEKRSTAGQIPVWEPSLCSECGYCALACPHAAIRAKAYSPDEIGQRPDGFASKPCSAEGLVGYLLTIQVVPDDCTGCGVCVDVCPAKSKSVARQKAINMSPKDEHLAKERADFEFFLSLKGIGREAVRTETVLGSQLLEPLFEFSSACAGCGETPYLKLLSQLFGDRLLIGNATGCSSIYGGHLPTTPWAKNADGRGPAWVNSLFEDNAEFGLGMRLGLDQKHQYAARLLRDLTADVGTDLAHELLQSPQDTEAEVAAQRGRVAELVKRLSEIATPVARQLASLADLFVRRSVWIVGGDGWACDIGFGGLDHVLASGNNVHVLVLDTGLCSDTGGHVSKSTPRSAVAKFAACGKRQRRKDLGRLALAYGHVYVAQVAIGADPKQTVRAFLDAESFRGPSLILAYSQCIAQGVNMSTAMTHQQQVTKSGLWPLYRYDPRLVQQGKPGFQLDSGKPALPFKAFAMTEARFALLARANPDHARELFDLAQRDVDEQWQDLLRLEEGGKST